MNNYSIYKPREFVDLIDQKFEDSVGRIGRMDVEWGTWSRMMNLEIRRRIEKDDSDKVVLGLIFGYWMAVSHLLELIYNYKGLKRFLLEKKIKRKNEEIDTIREQIYANT